MPTKKKWRNTTTGKKTPKKQEEELNGEDDEMPTFSKAGKYKVPDTNILLNMEKQVFSLAQKVATYRLETNKLTVENDWLYDRAKRGSKENQNYLNLSRQRIQDKVAEMKEMSRQAELEIQEADKIRLKLLSQLHGEKLELRVKLSNETFQLSTVSKTLSFVNPYKEEEERNQILKSLIRELETYQEKHERVTRNMKNKFLRERDELNRSLEHAISSVGTNLRQHLRPLIKKRLGKLNEMNIIAKELLAQNIRKKKELLEKRDKLVQMKASLQKDHRYWSDMNRMHNSTQPVTDKSSSPTNRSYYKKRAESLPTSVQSDELADARRGVSYADIIQINPAFDSEKYPHVRMSK